MPSPSSATVASQAETESRGPRRACCSRGWVEVRAWEQGGTRWCRTGNCTPGAKQGAREVAAGFWRQQVPAESKGETSGRASGARSAISSCASGAGGLSSGAGGARGGNHRWHREHRGWGWVAGSHCGVRKLAAAVRLAAGCGRRAPRWGHRLGARAWGIAAAGGPACPTLRVEDAAGKVGPLGPPSAAGHRAAGTRPGRRGHPLAKLNAVHAQLVGYHPWRATP